MSLWTKPLSEVGFPDVEAFCAAKIPEDTRIDYKADWPSKLSKQIAAFANTYGGLLLIGVEEDPDSRTPKRICGVQSSDSASERVVQAGLRLSPPVLAETTGPIALPSAPARSVYVIRVLQSRYAPHVDASADRVYVRSTDVSQSIATANIQRIEQMIRLRDKWDETREGLLAVALERFRLVRGHQLPSDPYLWISIRPEFPVGEVITTAECFRSVTGGGNRVRVSGGALGIRNGTVGRTKQVVRMGSLTTMGDLFDVDTRLAKIEDHQIIDVGAIAHRLRRALQSVKEVYASDDCSFFGPVRVTVGVERCRGAYSYGAHDLADHPIVDERFTCESHTDSMAIREGNLEGSSLTASEYEIMRQSCTGLGLPELPPVAFSI